MADPDNNEPTEIELEMVQRERVLELFSRVETYDARQSVIGFCEALIKAQRED